MNSKISEGKRAVLIVEDDRAIADLIEIHLENEGYEAVKAGDGAEALKVLAERPVQLVILDIMMPGMDGLEVCRRIRKSFDIPIIMLSAKSEDMDKVLGLSTGADDYLTKPFNVVELLARVNSQLRRYLYLSPRSAAAAGNGLISAGGVSMDREGHIATVNGREAALTPTEFSILLLLISHPGRVFSAEDIFRKVWEEDRYYDSNNTVMVHIRRIREKIEADPGHPLIIKTVWGVGYKVEK
jgi:two-component system, OmpR family, response regulator VanR